MSSRPVKVYSINVRPHTLLVLKRAHRFYETVARGDLQLWDRPKYKFHEPDLAVMRDTATELQELIQDLEHRIRRDASE